MAVVAASGTTLSLTTGLKSSELVTGDYQFIGAGRIQLIVKASAAAATGIRATLTVAGQPLVQDQLVPFAGTTGTISVNDNMMLDQAVKGGRLSLTFRNDSAGTLTVDYMVLFTPIGGR